MPKETIQHGGTHERTGGDSPTEIVEEPSLVVKWNRENSDVGGWVQVQLEADPRTFLLLSQDNCPTATSNTLSRQELNHLIRTLRRARDSAFGTETSVMHPHIQHLCNIAEQQDLIYIGVTLDKIRLVLEQIAEIGREASIKYARGAERVRFPQGGSIRFATPATIDRVRGMTVDHIFLDSHHYLDNKHIRDTIAPCFASGAGGERYSVIG